MKKAFTIFLIFCFLQTTAQQRLSEQMATTVMKTWKDSFALDSKPAKWTYDMGVILEGFEGLWMKTGEVKYYNYIQKQIIFLLVTKEKLKLTNRKSIILTM